MAATDLPPTAAMPDTSTCPRCGAGLRCGMTAGDSTCWCFSMPHVLPVPLAGEAAAGRVSCMCPACLDQVTRSLSTDTSDAANKPFPA